MITIQKVVEEIVSKMPFVEEGISRGIINLSGLAREIRPQIKKKLMKDAQEGAIIMALKRFTPQIKARSSHLAKVLKKTGDITVKSDLIEFTYENSRTLSKKIAKLFDVTTNNKNSFITISQGITETTIIANSYFEKDVKKIFKDENEILSLKNLSSITIKLPPENIEVFGIYYSITKVLAWNNISIVDTVSTSYELTCIFKDVDIDRAFSVLKRLVE